MKAATLVSGVRVERSAVRSMDKTEGRLRLTPAYASPRQVSTRNESQMEAAPSRTKISSGASASALALVTRMDALSAPSTTASMPPTTGCEVPSAKWAVT